MQFPNSVEAIGTLFALLLLYFLWRIKAKKLKMAPTPSGALPIIGHLHLLTGQEPSHRTLAAMADKYGPAIMLRLGVHHTLVVSSWELVKDCFTTNDKVFATRPRVAASKYLGYHHAIFAFTPYGPYWRGIRKVATLELLSKIRLDKLKHVRASVVNTSIKELYSLWTKDGGARPVKVEMRQWFEHLILNVITEMVAGKRYFGNMSSGYEDEAQRVRKAVAELMYLFGVFVVSDAVPYCEWLDFGGHIKAMKLLAVEFDYIFGKWLEEHRQKMDNFKSTYDRETIIKATILQVIAAGSDTMALTLIWALSLLMNNHHVLRKAQDELDSHVGRDRNVEEHDIKNLVYLNAIIKETLRLYPPAPLSVPHEAMEDCQVGGYHVPKGTRLFVNLWKLHRDPRVWPEPYEFKPERFLTTHADIDMKGQHFEFIPFGSGVRWCPGFNFATQVLHYTLARLLHGFNLDTPSISLVDMTEGFGITMPRATPLEILFSPRLPSKLF
ncbi:hypothetical protein NE237_012214 [Protea cynaroides]|uniref:Cytochrome P450 n=1 Tax=Protea cynaroides TaxID=273540 RepID=A0A9Q0GWD5_9MAGN|nr:hypothetical protein NE237_012214 [Protea cynaroides]